MTTLTAIFTSDGTWNSGSASAVWMTKSGGGGGTPANDVGSGGAGSAELVTGMLIPVTPNTDYAVVIGAGGLAAANQALPAAAGNTTFAGFKALGAGNYAHHLGGMGSNSGAGGGCGGSIGLISGGGFDPKGARESCHYSGGCGGSGTSPTYPSSPAGGPGVSGGILPVQGTAVGSDEGGGAGAGSLWGGNNGSDGLVAAADANATYYGSGAGGAGGSSGAITGSNGAAGVVILMTVQ